MGYIIRSGFSVRLADGSIHIGGEEVELTAEEFAANKHKLEGTQTSDDIVDWRNNNPSVENNNPNEDLTEIISQLELKVENIKSLPPYSFWLSGLSVIREIGGRGSVNDFLEAGSYIDYDDSDPLNPVWQQYDVPRQQIFRSQSTSTYFYLQKGVVKNETKFPRIEQLKNRLYVAYNGEIINAQSIGQGNLFSSIFDGSLSSAALVDSGGVRNLNCVPVAIPSTLNLQLPEGKNKLLVIGRNHYLDPSNPHKYEAQNASNGRFGWGLYASNGQRIASSVFDLDFSQYWDGQQLVNINNNDDATARFLYFCPFIANSPLGCWVQIYGNRRYSNLNTAKERWRSEEGAHFKPNFLGIAILVAVILGRKDATDASNLNQVAIIPIDPMFRVENNFEPTASNSDELGGIS